MSVASKILIPALAATALITGSLVAGRAPASASVLGIGFGSGATAAAAETAAQQDLVFNFAGCHLPPEFYVDGSGTKWTAKAVSYCLNAR
jgi:hypothetical protein